jgi:hypothetical protein
MDADGRPDNESVLVVVRATSHLATRIEFLRGRLIDDKGRARRRVRARLVATMAAYRALDKLVELDNEDENDRPESTPRRDPATPR